MRKITLYIANAQDRDISEKKQTDSACENSESSLAGFPKWIKLKWTTWKKNSVQKFLQKLFQFLSLESL